jgi:hypothetical protein
MSVEAEYEKDLAGIDHSGPHLITEEQKLLNRQVFAACRDVMPFDDIHKLSDADLIYRFLIARKWSVEEAVKNIREYVVWRKENRLNEVLWEPLPEEALQLQCKFQGFDKFGHPVFYDTPEPKVISSLLQKLPREICLRAHFAVMEQGRRWQKIYKTDRVSCVYDLSHLTIAIVTNPRAVGFLKELTKIDQHYYPENMRTMLLCNGGWTFNGLYKVIRPLLDPRVQKKIQFVNNPDQVAAWIDLDQVPVTHIGGKRAVDEGLLVENFNLSAPGSPPMIPGSPSTGGAKRLTALQLGSLPVVGVVVGSNENDDDWVNDDIEFKSLPSEDGEDDELSPNTSQGPPSPSRKPDLVVPPPTILSAALPTGAKSFDLVLKNIGNQDLTRVEAYQNDELLCYSTGQSVVQAGTEALHAELIAEAGHPIHDYLIIVDNQKIPHFICKKRNLHNEIQIFQPTAKGKISMRKNMQAKVEGDRVHTMTCRLREGAHDQRDWQITLHKDPTKTIQAMKVGDTIRFQNTLLPEGSFNPYLLFALAAGLTDLWFFS